MKCVFTCSIFVDSSTKRFLSVLGVFGKYFVKKKSEIFQETQFCPVLATQSRVSQVARLSRVFAGHFGNLFASGRSSREGYSEILAAQLATPSRVEPPVAKNT